MQTSATRAAAWVFTIALACYLLSFSGVPISDDEQLYAGVARNLAVNGVLDAGQLSGNPRLAGSYHGVEPAFPAIASLWYRLWLHSSFGHLQSLYLLPALFTALSAALIVLIAAQLGFPLRTGTLAALLFGLSTMAWPYAQTLFREPLLALLLLASFSAFLQLVGVDSRWPSALGWAALLFLLLAVLVLVRVVMAAPALAFLILLLLLHPALKDNRRRVALLSLVGLAALIGAVAWLASSRATDADLFYRFTGSFLHDAILRLSAISHAHLAEALLAPVVSPWKGLLFYSPACLLGIVSLVKSFRRAELVVLPACVLVVLLLVQALAYDDQWWTPTWGSRFLLPAIPLLVIASLPLLGRLADDGRRGRIVLGCLFALGFAIQLPAILFNSSAFTAGSYHDSATFPGSLIWNLGKTPIVAQWTAAASQGSNLLLWRAATARPGLALLVCALALGLLVIAARGLRSENSAAEAPGLHFRLQFGVSLVALCFTSAALLRLGAYDPAYQMREFEPLCAFLRGNLQASEPLIVYPYPGPAWQYLMNAECGQRVWYSVPYNWSGSEAPAGPFAADLIARKVPAGARYWLIQQYWSGSFAPASDSLAPGGDPLVQLRIFESPVRMFVGLYTHKPR